MDEWFFPLEQMRNSIWMKILPCGRERGNSCSFSITELGFKHG
jgi:hypothetical protein